MGIETQTHTMTVDRDQDYWAGLVRELCKLPAETSWLEFKHNSDEPDAIGDGNEKVNRV